MVKGSANLCSAIVLLAIISAVASETNISLQIGEINSKLTYLQGRLDLCDYINEGNVSALQHRIEINETKCAENVNNLVDRMDALATDVRKLTTLEDKINALATTVTHFVEDIQEALLKPLSSCVDAYARPLFNRGSGVYNIQLNGSTSSFDVVCMTDPHGGLPWTVVQRRVDDTVDFYRKWAEYQRGFGDVEGNFFIGLDKLHALTTKGEPQELWVMLTDPGGISAHAYYDAFAIGNETEKYPLKVLGKYSGNAGDSLRHHKSEKFSTYDNDNDMYPDVNCAEYYKSAWWFQSCHQCQLNGVYTSIQKFGGLYWESFRGSFVSMKYAHMAIRPARK